MNFACALLLRASRGCSPLSWAERTERQTRSPPALAQLTSCSLQLVMEMDGKTGDCGEEREVVCQTECKGMEKGEPGWESERAFQKRGVLSELRECGTE